MNGKRRLFFWIRHWIELAEAIIGIITLGFYRPWWSFNFTTYRAKAALRRRMK